MISLQKSGSRFCTKPCKLVGHYRCEKSKVHNFTFPKKENLLTYMNYFQLFRAWWISVGYQFLEHFLCIILKLLERLEPSRFRRKSIRTVPIHTVEWGNGAGTSVLAAVRNESDYLPQDNT